MDFTARTSVRLFLTLLCCGAAGSATAHGEPSAGATELSSSAIDALPNPFEGIETWTYPNGLVVHFNDMPASEEVFFRATLPVGSREDPEGLAGLAHFVEHMMFTGADGMSKAEFQLLVEDRGGSTNASTNRDRTDYYLELPAAEWSFGLQWFADLLLDKDLVEQFVEEERGAVILERDLKKKTPLDYFVEWVLTPEWARPAGFWERELGLPTDRNSTIGTWESVQAARRDDLQAFHERWYGPQNMTIAIFGPLDRKAVKSFMDGSFGAAERFGQDALVHFPAKPANRPRREVSFEQRRGHYYELNQLVPDHDSEDWQKAYFLTRLMSEHLNDILRRERRAAYGVRSSFRTFRGQLLIEVGGNFDPAQQEEAIAYIESFYQDLSEGRVSPELFEALRKRVVAPLLLSNQEPSKLAAWVVTSFYQKDVMGAEFPDLVRVVRETSAADLSSWMETRLASERRVVTLDRPSPLWPLAEVGLVLLAGGLAFVLARRVLTRPLDLRDVVYVRKTLYGLLAPALGFAVFLAVFTVSIHLFSIAHGHFEAKVIEPVDSYVVQGLHALALACLWVMFFLIGPACIPRKILLLKDHWRIKYLSYRSRRLAYEDIEGLERRHVLAVLLDWKAWPCRVLHWGLFRKGIHLRLGRGSYFFRTRNDAELIEEFDKRRPASVDEVVLPDEAADFSST